MEDKIIELADYFISENTTYREAKIACEKLLKQVSHEIELRALESETKKQKGEYMSQQHQKWIQIVKDKLNSEGMTQTHLARACGVKKPTISELLKYGKGSDRLKNRVCDVLGIDESWVDLGEQEMNNTAQKVTRIDKDAWDIATELANEYGVSICHIISESVRYCAENADFKEVDVVVKRLSVGGKVLEQEEQNERIRKNSPQ